MKRLIIVLAVTVTFLALGCEKRAGRSAEADRYDAKIDGPVCVLTAGADENLLSDQKALSRQTELDAAAVSENKEKTIDEDTEREDTNPAPTAGPAGAVRQVMVDLIANFKAERMDRLADVLPSAEAAALRRSFKDFNKLNQKEVSLVQLFRTKLKMEPPPDVKPELKKDATKMLVYAIFGVNFSQVSLDDLSIKQDGETVVISGPNVRKVTFSKDEQVWKIQVSPDARRLVELLEEAVTISERMTDELISGINNGSVTKDNHRAKMDEIEQRHGAVMGAKIRALMSKLLIPWMMPAPTMSPPTSNTPVAEPTVGIERHRGNEREIFERSRNLSRPRR
ncbi:MAG: hypothetical protein SVV80_08065 [Planctomycetota bacterium]|nr:hypothetical protein [Planctomycetota bacterium]